MPSYIFAQNNVAEIGSKAIQIEILMRNRSELLRLLSQKRDCNFALVELVLSVTLTGQVDTDRQFERAVSLAESVQGVDDVKTENLIIKASKSPMKDIVINAKVKGVFLKSGLLESNKPSQWPVKIETKNNTVFLTGTVSKHSTRKKLVALAQHVVGVKSVNSAIVIKS